jgi:hypothetical protein
VIVMLALEMNYTEESGEISATLQGADQRIE